MFYCNIYRRVANYEDHFIFSIVTDHSMKQKGFNFSHEFQGKLVDSCHNIVLSS